MTSLPSIRLTLGFEPAFNRLMSDTKEYSKQIWDETNQSAAIHSFTATLGSTLVSVPVELFAAAENALKLPLVALSAVLFELPLAAVGYTARWLCCEKLGQTLIDMQKGMPGMIDLIYTIYKIVGLVFGALATLTLGMCSTHLNYGLHRFLGLINPSLIPEPEKIKVLMPCTHGDEIAALKEKLRRVNLDIDAKNASIAKIEQELTQFKGLKSAIEAKEREITRLKAFENQTAALQSELDKLQEEKKTLKEHLAAQPSADVKALAQKVKELESQQKDLQSQLEEKEKELAAKNSPVPIQVPADPQVAILQAKIEELDKQTKAEIEKLTKEKQELESQLKGLQKTPATPPAPVLKPGAIKNPVQTAFNFFGKMHEEKKALEKARDEAKAKAAQLESDLRELQVKKVQVDDCYEKLQLEHSKCAEITNKAVQKAEAAKTAAEGELATTKEKVRKAAEEAQKRGAELEALLTAEKEKAARLQKEKDSEMDELRTSKSQLEEQKRQLDAQITDLKRKQLDSIADEQRQFAEKLNAIDNAIKGLFTDLFNLTRPEGITAGDEQHLINEFNAKNMAAQLGHLKEMFISVAPVVENSKQLSVENQTLILNIQKLQQREQELLDAAASLRKQMDALHQSMASETQASKEELVAIIEEFKAMPVALKLKQSDFDKVKRQLDEVTQAKTALQVQYDKAFALLERFQSHQAEFQALKPQLELVSKLEAELAQYRVNYPKLQQALTDACEKNAELIKINEQLQAAFAEQEDEENVSDGDQDKQGEKKPQHT